MSQYDFRSLSPNDFELLCRDLLQENLGIRLECFSAGPDSGIDLRYHSDSKHIVVQCKHYVGSGFNSLLRKVGQNERKKIDELKPTRYILATSVSLTPNRKEKLMTILTPYCQNKSDILGCEDINNLLKEHSEVEQKNFKLWLTSTSVLERVLHAGIFFDSDMHLERIRLRLCRYVPNQSFDRAKAILDENRFCIIAGIPGIGKTTLAEALLVDLVDRQNFKVYRIAHDLSELRSIKNSKSKQVFYFDDFLGKTTLESFQKNEDQRLVELMEEVTENPNWRFILTTREYILEAAKRSYETLAYPSINLKLCVIEMSDYTRSIKAKILYNHIYFSDLSKEYKLALLENRGYEAILRHRNYNPRVIEYMTRSNPSVSTSTLYRQKFIDSLDNPARIWDHAFRYQISEAARHLLLALTTLSYETNLKNLEKVFWRFYEFRQTKFKFSTSAEDFSNALRELDGNFIRLEKKRKYRGVSFHNPSIKDFIEKLLDNSEADVIDLFKAAQFYEQYVYLWNRFNKGIKSLNREILITLADNLFGPGAHISTPSYEKRADFVIRVADVLNIQITDRIVKSMLDRLGQRWEQGLANRRDLVGLVIMLIEHGLKQDNILFLAAQSCLFINVEDIEDFLAATNFCEKYPEAISTEEQDVLRNQFIEYIPDAMECYWDDDPDMLRYLTGGLEDVGNKLEVDVIQYILDIDDRIDEIESERAQNEASDYEERNWSNSDDEIDDVHRMFDGLENDLQDF